MIHAAILGFGIVGGGIAEVLEQNKKTVEKSLGDEFNIKYVLDIRDFGGTEWESKVVKDISVITQDKEITIVAETMGGSHPAYEFTVECLKSGKSVVTSNKELVANFGYELLKLAEENGVFYLFEASVGGGIPLIRSIRSSFCGNEITEINGILNGTTNYVLTQMEGGAEFDDALKEAQQLGYAEKNPSADIDGIDTQRKICILTALATKTLLNPSDIYTRSMREITKRDTDAAEKAGYRIKLIGHMKKIGDKTSVNVLPCFVPMKKPLANISDVYNGIVVSSEVTGDVMYYGQGAGRYPTAGAVLADMLSIASGAESGMLREIWQKADENFLLTIDNYECRHYIRVSESEKDRAMEIFGEIEIVEMNDNKNFEFITTKIKCSEVSRKLEKLGQFESHIHVL